MSKNIISNQKVEVPTGSSLNDKDYMNSLLTSLKELVKNYAVVLTEASNDNLYKRHKKIFDSLVLMQRETYEYMFYNGWYSLEKATKDKITTKYNMLCTELNNLGKED